ncbi:hypothetical protein ACTSKR_07740 [Chitinibacteraceae bacterium HSL-7]
MKYPESVPGIGLVGGKFSNGDPAQGIPASLDPAEWANQVTDELLAVIIAAGLPPSEADSAQLLRATIPCLITGTALPSTNIGPIWHDDYNSIMTWQVFNANGAAYTGYASVLIGSLLLDTQPTPRTGYVKSGVANLSRTTDAALRGWAMHNGVMVAVGVWQAGQIVCADNADGTTFRAYDLRGEFLRVWDDSRGADVGRAFGSWQQDAIRNIVASTQFATDDNGSSGVGPHLATGAFASVGTSGVVIVDSIGPRLGGSALSFDASRVVPTAADNRGRNTALAAMIKR